MPKKEVRVAQCPQIAYGTEVGNVLVIDTPVSEVTGVSMTWIFAFL